MKIAICDDQKIMRDILKEQLEIYASNRKNCFVYTEYDNGLDMIKDNVVYDLIFMDYQMDRINGIDTAKELRQRKIETPIIFLTSFPDVVFDVFEVKAYRFLLKPINESKLAEALDTLIDEFSDENFLVIKTDEGSKRIKINDIIYAEAVDKYCYISTTSGTYLYKKTLSTLEEQLPSNLFFRSHRTYIVNFKHIVSISKTEVLLDSKEKALISKTKVTSFKKSFFDYVKSCSMRGEKQ